jgi:tripartite ATP-independent transporter DctM subunit
MAALPLAELAARQLFGRGVPASQALTQHLTLWVALLGAALAAREGQLLSLATGELLPAGPRRRATAAFAAAVGSGVAALLARACLDLVRVERSGGSMVGAGVPAWVAQLVLPVGFLAIALRLAWRAGPPAWPRAVAGAGLLAGLLLGQYPQLLEGKPAWPGLLLVLAATALGSPLFAALGGAALLLFMADGVPIAAVPAETYRLAVSNTLPAIPLFTLAGFLLAEGQASLRLLRVFRALFGWVPGGTAVVCTLICAFFTTFTGGSGVTILALGPLLYRALVEDGYRPTFSLGLITAAGALGLLFPPSLPLILYGVVAQVPIEDLFLGGIGPGLLMVALSAGWGVREGLRGGARRTRFGAREAAAALWGAKWELMLPVLVLVAIFAGFATLVEAAALTALYAGLSQALVHRDLSLRRDLRRVLSHCVLVVGGVLVILGVAVGLTSYLVDAQVPARLVEWAREGIGSPLLFLLALNLFLIVVGCLMDIFSAIVVVVPLIVPLAAVFGVDPVHLGVIFVANLELGYLTPPVGMNLFLASYRFERPLLEVYRAALPFLLLRAVGVLLITYLPALTLFFLR